MATPTRLATPAGKSPEVRSTQSATTVVTALNVYGRDFDHAGWKPIMIGH